MYADSKVEGLLHCEELALHNHFHQPHRPFTDVVDRSQASKEEEPAPSFQKQDPLHNVTLCWQGQASFCYSLGKLASTVSVYDIRHWVQVLCVLPLNEIAPRAMMLTLAHPPPLRQALMCIS